MRIFVSILATITLPVCAQQPNETSLAALVDSLQDVSAVGLGYSSLFAGSAFLPRKDMAQMHTGVLGAEPPQESTALRKLVAAGAAAIPVLSKHLDDKRPTQLKPVSGMMWMEWNDEYDFNRRTLPLPPKEVNRNEHGGGGQPRAHQICVGDLCFVALGQIVNRSFNATRYQPSGGLIVSSPANSERLLKVVREDYSAMTRDQHRDALVQDFKKPDHEYRLNGAATRLAFYYPEIFDDLAVRQLAVPVYDVFVASDFVRKVLYPLKSVEKRREKLRAHVKERGEAARDGILLQLFDDLEIQIADEEGRLHPPLKKKYDARNVLTALFDYSPPFSPPGRPFVATWAGSERVRFIHSLGNSLSTPIIQEVLRIFREIKDDDALAFACINALRGSGNNEELAAFCKRREAASNRYDTEYRDLRLTLEPAAERPKAP